ncbi:MAG: LptE family protein [Candidatus Krumholzibacteriota bacterium]
MNAVKLLMLAAAVLAAAGSCGYYGTTSRVAGDIKKIYIPYLDNETPEPSVEIEITERIIDGIIKDNTLKVVDEDEADAVLEGSVVKYANEPYTYSERSSQNIRAEQYRLTIGIRVSLYDSSGDEYVWENKTLEGKGDYFLESSQEQNYEDARENVYTDLVDGILSSTLQDW